MSITTQYRIIVRCDTCRKKVVAEDTGIAPNPVPRDWIQAAPPGETSQKEFCSLECLTNWEADTKPWDEE